MHAPAYPNHSFSKYGGLEALFSATIFNKCNVGTSSVRQERYIMKTNLELTCLSMYPMSSISIYILCLLFSIYILCLLYPYISYVFYVHIYPMSSMSIYILCLLCPYISYVFYVHMYPMSSISIYILCLLYPYILYLLCPYILFLLCPYILYPIFSIHINE